MSSEDLSLIQTEDSYQGWEGRVTKTPAQREDKPWASVVGWTRGNISGIFWDL